MKKIMSMLLSVVMLFSITAGLDLSAYANTSSDWEYEVLDNGTAEITDYSGSAEALEIPSMLDGHTVTTIGFEAFYGCKSLTNVTIPEGVTSIDSLAFANCDNLTNVTIPESVTSIGLEAFDVCSSLTSINVKANNQSYSSEDGVLFDKDKKELIQYPIGNERTSYLIPDGVITIGTAAFRECDSLTNVTIPNSVITIGFAAFLNCSSLAEVIIGNSVKTIENTAFSVCDNLTSIIIPSSVTSIGGYAFNCNSLVNLPMDENAFYHAWHNFCREMDIANGATVYRNQITKSTLAPDLEPYLLRHTFCTDCQAAGVPLNVAKELMGHSDISVTAKIYTHMIDEVFEQNRKRLAEYANQKEQKAVNE